MSYPKSTKSNHQRRTDRREVHSRPTGVNQSRSSRMLLNQKLQRIHQKTRSNPKVLQELIRDQWENNFRPQWFITLLWNDLPTQFDVVKGHAGTFRNVFLTQLMGCNSPTKIPDPPERPSSSLCRRGNQWSLEDDRSLRSTPISIWVLYLTLWTISGIWTT